MKKDIKYNFCIVTYETFPNPITENLKTFLLENYKCNILYIAHPMLDLPEGFKISSKFDLFLNNEFSESKSAYHWQLYWPLLYIKDILLTLFWCIKFKRKYDVYFASGNLNPIPGIILRELGLVHRVVYQCLDYYPVRYENKLLNWFYFQLDKFCVRFSDETWNVNPLMAKAREDRMDMVGKPYKRQFTVPGGIWFYKTRRLTFSKIDRKKIVYRGMLLDHMGVDLPIKAMPLILQEMPSVKFEIVGTGKEEGRLKKLAKQLGVSKNVVFHGFVQGRGAMEKILSDAALGVATFNMQYADKIRNSDPGKIKDYMLLGMTVITTKAIYSSEEIKKQKCGIVVSDNPKDLALAILKILKNKALLKRYRENATKYIENFDCVNILKPNVERVLRNGR